MLCGAVLRSSVGFILWLFHSHVVRSEMNLVAYKIKPERKESNSGNKDVFNLFVCYSLRINLVTSYLN
jgi:hypothetical protein